MAAERHRAIDSLSFIENVKLLSEIISFAENKNIKVILITSPAYHTYVENLDKKQLNTTSSTVNELIVKHQKTKYYNMLQDSSFVSNDFYDADHLNEIGAKKFSLKIDSLIILNNSY